MTPPHPHSELTSDAVAVDVLLDRGAATSELRFGRRVRGHVVLGCGAWGVLLVVPMLVMLVNGEIPPLRALPVVVVFFSIGGALFALAAREFVDGASLRVEANALRFERGPIVRWPRRVVPLVGVTSVRADVHPDSFAYPATWRGHPIVRPWIVVLGMEGRGESRLPLILGESDAFEVARFVTAALACRDKNPSP